MTRRLFTLASLLSLVLCLATAALWVRSYWVGDSIRWESAFRLYGAGASRGRFMFVACQIPSTGTPDTPLRFKYFSDRPPLPPPGDVATFFRRIGFLYGSGEVNRGFLVFHQTIATVPCWFVAAGTLLLPLRFGVVMRGRWRRESRLRRGLCTACGYDLRETVGRCPECGMTTEAEAKT